MIFLVVLLGRQLKVEQGMNVGKMCPAFQGGVSSDGITMTLQDPFKDMIRPNKDLVSLIRSYELFGCDCNDDRRLVRALEGRGLGW